MELLTHENLDTRIATASAACAMCLSDQESTLLRTLCERVLALRRLCLERLLPAYCVLWGVCQVMVAACL